MPLLEYSQPSGYSVMGFVPPLSLLSIFLVEFGAVKEKQLGAETHMWNPAEAGGENQLWLCLPRL